MEINVSCVRVKSSFHMPTSRHAHFSFQGSFFSFIDGTAKYSNTFLFLLVAFKLLQTLSLRSPFEQPRPSIDGPSSATHAASFAPRDPASSPPSVLPRTWHTLPLLPFLQPGGPSSHRQSNVPSPSPTLAAPWLSRSFASDRWSVAGRWDSARRWSCWRRASSLWSAWIEPALRPMWTDRAIWCVVDLDDVASMPYRWSPPKRTSPDIDQNGRGEKEVILRWREGEFDGSYCWWKMIEWWWRWMERGYILWRRGVREGRAKVRSRLDVWWLMDTISCFLRLVTSELSAMIDRLDSNKILADFNSEEKSYTRWRRSWIVSGQSLAADKRSVLLMKNWCRPAFRCS